jgi:erythromycin esterase-like protein
MYDIKIFLEDNGKFGAKIDAWDEIIYWVWNNQKELMDDLKEWLKISYESKDKSEKVSKLFSYFNFDKKELLCH